jgi:hypothetical protein
MADFENMPIGTMEVLKKCARTFREYESSHRGKASRAQAGTQVQEDRLLKAKRNGAMADEIEKLLAQKNIEM